MAKKNELAVLDTFKLAKPFEGMDPELLAELEDELDDLDDENGITCRRIKEYPSDALRAYARGGALAFDLAKPMSGAGRGRGRCGVRQRAAPPDEG